MLDDRFDTITAYMRKAFPGSSKDLVLESLGPDRVGCSFVEKGSKCLFRRRVFLTGICSFSAC